MTLLALKLVLKISIISAVYAALPLPLDLWLQTSMEDSVGPLAMVSYELRQAWKGATVIVKSCAEVWLTGNSTLTC